MEKSEHPISTLVTCPSEVTYWGIEPYHVTSYGKDSLSPEGFENWPTSLGNCEKAESRALLRNRLCDLLYEQNLATR